MGRYGPFQIQAVFLRLRTNYVLAVEAEVGGRPISKLPAIINEAKLVSTKITLVAEPWSHDISGRYVRPYQFEYVSRRGMPSRDPGGRQKKIKI